MRRRTIALTLSLLGLTAGTVGARDAIVLDPWTRGSANLASAGGIHHVRQIAYTGGTDLEFTSAEVLVDGLPQVRDYAVAGRRSGPVQVIDVTDPDAAFVATQIPCRLNQNDIQIAGSLLIMASDVRSSCDFPGGTQSFLGFAIADISDPRAPELLGYAPVPKGAHNLTFHPGGRYVYVSNSELTSVGYVHIYDLADPAQPVKVRDLFYHPAHSPHDITFNAEGTRASVAAISHTDILDTSDPASPTLMHTIVDPAINISHQADPTPDGRFMIISDELAGAATGPVCPGGGLHVYDVSNELAPPVKVGVFWADPVELSGTCTAHVFRINPDGETMAIAWYNAGVHVLDFGDLLKAGAAGTGATLGIGVRSIASMKMPGANTWSAKMWQERHPGYVFANDLARGFDVFFVPELAG